MEYDIKDIIAYNIKSIRKKYNISLQSLAIQIGVAKSTLSNFENKKTTPSVEVLYDICKFFKINMNIFVSEYLREDEFFNFESVGTKSEDIGNKFDLYNKYRGTYNIYYFKTNFITDSEISTGKLRIAKHTNRLIVDASFGNKTYEGHLSIVGRHTYISLTGTTHFEKVLVILHDPPSLNNYIGGIGISISVSSGRIQNPCCQKLIISRKDLSGVEEIKELLCINEKFVVNIEEALDDKVYRMLK